MKHTFSFLFQKVSHLVCDTNNNDNIQQRNASANDVVTNMTQVDDVISNVNISNANISEVELNFTNSECRTVVTRRTR